MDSIKRLITANIHDVESKISAIASQLGYTDLSAITAEEAAVIADEVQKNNGGITTQGSKGSLAKNDKKSKISPPQQPNQQPNTTHPVNPSMKEVISDLVKGTDRIYATTDRFCQHLTIDKSRQIVERLRQVNPDILASVVDQLEIEVENTDKFCNELEQILRESYSSI